MPSIRFFDATEPHPVYPPISEEPQFQDVIRNFNPTDALPIALCTAGGYGLMFLMTRNWKGTSEMIFLELDSAADFPRPILSRMAPIIDVMSPRLKLTAYTLGSYAGFMKAYSNSHCTRPFLAFSLLYFWPSFATFHVYRGIC